MVAVAVTLAVVVGVGIAVAVAAGRVAVALFPAGVRNSGLGEAVMDGVFTTLVTATWVGETATATGAAVGGATASPHAASNPATNNNSTGQPLPMRCPSSTAVLSSFLSIISTLYAPSVGHEQLN